MYFHRASATTVGNDLEIRFRELGLKEGQPVQVKGFAKAIAYWRCQGTTAVVVAEVEASGEFTGGPDGEATGSLRISPPDLSWEATEDATEAELLSVTYSEVQVADQTNHRFLDIPGTFGPAAVEPALPPRIQVSLTWNPPTISPMGPPQIFASPPEGAERPAST